MSYSAPNPRLLADFFQNDIHPNIIYKDHISAPEEIFVMMKGKGAGHRIWAKLVGVLTDTTISR